MATWRQWGLQDAASPLIQQLTFFHDHAILVLTLILSVVMWASLSLISNQFFCRTILEGQQVETIWTILPALILITLALPSLTLLYLLDEVNTPQFTVKVIGHQWYWRYEYPEAPDLSIDSYMTPEIELTPGQARLLEVDNRVVFPYLTEARLIVTRADVIHSWAVPAIGVKIDAIPGRLNQAAAYLSRPGLFYGQCSEICGANHRFIPIALESISPAHYLKWVYPDMYKPTNTQPSYQLTWKTK